MKKLMLLTIGLFTLGSAMAQRPYPPARRYPRSAPPRQVEGRYNPHGDFYQVKFGLVGGLNVANIMNVNDANFKTNTKLGYNLGGSLDIPIVYPLAFEGEVLYSQKGYSAYTNTGSFTQHDNYIDVPLLAKIQLVPGFHLVVGPQISFLTSTTNVNRVGFTYYQQNVYDPNTQGFDKTLVDGVAGVSIDLGPHAELRGRYTLDLQDNNNYSGVNPNIRNQVWQVGLGFKF